MNIYDIGLDKNPANFTQLTPLTFIERSATIFPEKTSVIYGTKKYSWKETYDRCRKLASALTKIGINKNDTVSIIAANTPAMYEAHFGVPMSGAVLNTLNVRLSADTLAFMLQHSDAKVLLVDKEFSEVIAKALNQIEHSIYVIDIDDVHVNTGFPVGKIEYEAFLETGDNDFNWIKPENEWDAIALNYTSGTTGNPKGVVYHHRGAALNAINDLLVWKMSNAAVYLWTLPMFHCNGWCFPWALAAASATSVCLRKVIAKDIYKAIADEKVDHFCGAPIVLQTMINAHPDDKKVLEHKVKAMVAGAAPPASVIENIEKEGFEITHVYGLTETYGPSVICEWKEEWDDLPLEERAELKSRQGVRYLLLDELDVLNPQTMEPVPADGVTIGEIMMKGNNVMKGYLKNPSATEEAFKKGWFHTGDLAVKYPDGYVQIKDRSKDIVISGGENISTIEVEGVIYRIPEVEEVACVAKPDEKWGEVVCAFIKLKEGENITNEQIVEHCRKELAGFKVPKYFYFMDLPKTSTGKVQKFELRAIAKTL
ncbi:acyl-CoA synthetase [Flavobacterium sp. NRK F10]|uniref:Acyl-CoA synthetase n=1 Tax=Flavobacterium sediminis TaxID=2201181 RepID=A0A2U8QR61_9FLAO|nr:MULTISPECIES: acyl-CoA synthetase [Flavobacterium]AWM12603.1 acyl-CoA synthetase [Flavobacterium sediminis]MCO6173713.1 acyl-CoA synthetase [Flavobacterium sp. NRK F10]